MLTGAIIFLSQVDMSLPRVIAPSFSFPCSFAPPFSRSWALEMYRNKVLKVRFSAVGSCATALLCEQSLGARYSADIGHTCLLTQRPLLRDHNPLKKSRKQFSQRPVHTSLSTD